VFLVSADASEESMSSTQLQVIDSCASWIGAHALAILLVIFVTALGVIAILWRLFELKLWAHPDGWRQRVLGLPFAERLHKGYPRVWRFLCARLAPDSYLGLHLTIGLLVTLAAMLGFGGLADQVVDREELTEFDQQLAISLHHNGRVDQIGIFKAITHFGDYRTLVCVGLAVSLILLFSRRWLLLIGWVVALTGSGFLNAMLKALFHRGRPVFADPWLTEPAWSFPSGHAMGSLVAYGMLAYILIVAWRVPFPRTIVSLSVGLVLAIGFSRIYLGVHFFSDVVAGYAAATMWLSICISGCEVARRRPRMRQMPET
jgi:membrane-associated phospholipid phosphatase